MATGLSKWKKQNVLLDIFSKKIVRKQGIMSKRQSYNINLVLNCLTEQNFYLDHYSSLITQIEVVNTAKELKTNFVFLRLNVFYSIGSWTFVSKYSKITNVPRALCQWFSTEVPRHFRVPWNSVRGAASHYMYWTFSLF